MDYNVIVKMYKQGYTQTEIAKITGYSQPNISIALRAMKIKPARKFNADIIQNPIIKEWCKFNNLNIDRLSLVIGCSKEKAKAFVEEETETRLSVNQFRRLLNAMGKTFEEVFGG